MKAMGDELGKGGMGVVYQAFDLMLMREVALKVLNFASLKPHSQERLIHEARIIAKLKHPNIVAVYDVGELDNSPFFVMELVEGDSLDTFQSQNLEEVLELCRGILIQPNQEFVGYQNNQLHQCRE